MTVAKYLVLLLIIVSLGCGIVADKGRIRIAKLGDRYFTRGDLMQLLRDMPDDERPIIRTQGDLILVVNSHMDEEVRLETARALEEEGVLVRINTLDPDEARAQAKAAEEEGKVPVLRLEAQRLFDEANPDYISDIINPEDFGLNERDLAFLKDERESGIDLFMDQLMGREAVSYRAKMAYRMGKISATDEQLQQQYDLLKDQMSTLEMIGFKGIRFPKDGVNPEEEAAWIRKRLDNGEDIDRILMEYLSTDPSRVVESRIENNPASQTFRSFWAQASGAEPGDVIGPVFMPTYEVLGQDGKTVERVPDSYLVFVVVNHQPARTYTLEEAKPYLLPSILYGEMMELLRAEAGLEIYEDKFPDPEMFGSSDELLF